jgi:hypothetical protein
VGLVFPLAKQVCLFLKKKLFADGFFCKQLEVKVSCVTGIIHGITNRKLIEARFGGIFVVVESVREIVDTLILKND